MRIYCAAVGANGVAVAGTIITITDDVIVDVIIVAIVTYYRLQVTSHLF